MMTAEAAFHAGLRMVREAGIPAKGNDIPVIAAYNVFHNHAAGKEFDPRFDDEGPRYAKLLILTAYAGGSK